MVGEVPADGLRRSASERRQSLEPGIESGAGDLQPAERCEPFAHSRAAVRARYQLDLAPGFLARFPAIFRVRGLDIPWVCVGPPTTTRSAPSRMCASAEVTGTTETSAQSASPSAMTSATFLVLPNIDS